MSDHPEINPDLDPTCDDDLLEPGGSGSGLLCRARDRMVVC